MSRLDSARHGDGETGWERTQMLNPPHFEFLDTQMLDNEIKHAVHIQGTHKPLNDTNTNGNKKRQKTNICSS